MVSELAALIVTPPVAHTVAPEPSVTETVDAPQLFGGLATVKEKVETAGFTASDRAGLGVVPAKPGGASETTILPSFAYSAVSITVAGAFASFVSVRKSEPESVSRQPKPSIVIFSPGHRSALDAVSAIVMVLRGLHGALLLWETAKDSVMQSTSYRAEYVCVSNVMLSVGVHEDTIPPLTVKACDGGVV